MKRVDGLLIDLDGTIYNDSQPVPGAMDTIAWLHTLKIPFRFITNTTMKSRTTLQQKLLRMGIEVKENEIFSAAYAGSLYVRQTYSAACHLLLLDDAKKDYQGLESDSEFADYVIVGDLGDKISFDKLNKAFRCLINGADLIALQKNRFWMSDQGYTLDAGAFVALLEYAANKEAILIGKPDRAFFDLVLRDLGLKADEVVMIGDDIESDIAGAKAIGMRAALVQTGKFRTEDLARADVQPDFLLGSIGELPGADLSNLFVKPQE
jgi:HAD superfamily hydrolase (TIGR01458 family)